MNLKEKIPFVKIQSLMPKQFTAPVFFLVAFVLTIFLLINPLLSEIKALSDEFLSIKTEIAMFGEEEKNIKDNKEFYKENKEFFELINNAFVDLNFPVVFIRFLEDTAQESRMDIKIFRLTAEREKEAQNTLSFQLSGEGNYLNFMRFLNKLENSFYFIRISDLNISRLSLEDNTINTSFRISVLAEEKK